MARRKTNQATTAAQQAVAFAIVLALFAAVTISRSGWLSWPGILAFLVALFGVPVCLFAAIAVAEPSPPHPPDIGKNAALPRPEYKRQAIPERVRHEVWRRDQGRCMDCGSRERLHFDHIIPVSEGGSNTVRNIEIRCEACNLRKGARI